MRTITLPELSGNFPGCPIMAYGEDFFILDISFPAGAETRLAYPCRFGGLVSMYCLVGEFRLGIGMDTYFVKKDCFAISLPGDIVSLEKLNKDSNAKIRIMAISDKLLSEMEFDYSKSLVTYRNRMVKADRQYKILIQRFRDIFGVVMFSKHTETDRSLGYLLGSMFIELSHIWEKLAQAPVVSDSRNGRITEKFTSMLAASHVEHRDLDFYALKMGITPKYLSAAVKTESGRTAVDWITSYVILEAKYYLKYTNLSVKKIAYELHFANQMDFYRYFRRHAGQSPTEYRTAEK